ncbi:hypothetical protein TYRP_005120 [Tyrophagus putrescentiae]|nr:hypothetical protein TYRP_005120 [Tyrophagus putrescentiae]
MSTSINISNDLNNYLKTSGSSINGTGGQSSSSASNGFMNGWFSGSSSGGGGTSSKPSGGDSKSWFSYQPLRTSPDDDAASVNSSSTQSGSGGGWLRNPFGTKEPEPPGWLPTLSRTQRIIGFLLFIFMGITCFGLSTMYIPVLIFKARKFSILFTFGSAFIVLSFAILFGPVSHLKHQFSRERLPFTLAYFGSLIATLYFAMELQSTILTILAAITQIVALVWYVFTYIPGGQTGLMFFSRVAASTVSKTLPV